MAARTDVLKRVMHVCLAVAILIAAVNAVSWILFTPEVARAHPRGLPMPPSAIAATLILSISIMVRDRLRSKQSSGFWLRAERFLLLALALAMLIITLERVVGLPLDIESALYGDEMIRIDGFLVGRVSPLASISYLSQIAALILIQAQHGKTASRPPFRHWIGDFANSLTLVAIIGGLISITGYFYRAIIPHGPTDFPMSLSTSIGQLLIGISIIALGGTASWPLNRLTGDSIGATLRRTLLPLSGVILLYGWINAAVITEAINPALSSGILTTLFLVILTFAAGRITSRLGGRIEAAEAARAKSVREVHAIFDASPNALMTVDGRNGAILLVNPSVQKVFGYAPAELIGKPVEILIPEAYRESHSHDREVFMRAPVARPMGAGRHLVGRHKSGREIPVEIALTPLNTDHEVMILATITDISVRRGLEDQRDRALKAREDFIGIVSHEIKNPLNVIGTGTQLLARLLPADISRKDLVHKQLKSIETATHRINRMAADLLDVTRIEAGHLRIEAKSIAVPALIDEIITHFKPLTDAKGVQLSAHIEPGVGTITCDRDRIIQVLSNLLGNSLKFTQARGRISLRVSFEEHGLKFEVEDTGAGISGEDLAHIFDRFWQGRQKQHLGAGLGLFIAKGIIEAHGGSIDAESTPGKGSLFRFELPFKAVEKKSVA